MLNHISWSTYWTFLAVSLVLYYSYVAWVNRRVLFTRRIAAAPPALAESSDELFPHADACGRELDAYLEQAAYGKPSRNELVFGIHQVIKKYPSLRGSAYEEGLSRLIHFSATDKCAIHLSEEDIRQVWLV